MSSVIVSLGSKTIKPTAYLNMKIGGDNSMLIKGNEIVTQTIKRLSKVNNIGIRLDCLKIRNMPVPSSRMSY